MLVKLSPAAQERVESLVRDGAYPDVEAAVEAAVAHLELSDFEGIDVEEMSRTAREAYSSVQARLVDDAYETELKGKLKGILVSKQQR